METNTIPGVQRIHANFSIAHPTLFLQEMHTTNGNSAHEIR